MLSPTRSFGQTGSTAECTAWGNLRGIRVGGELMAFTTGIRAIGPATTEPSQNGSEKLINTRYVRDGNKQIITGGIPLGRGTASQNSGAAGRRGRGGSALTCNEVIEDVGPDTVKIDVDVTAGAATSLGGVYFYVHLPASQWTDAGPGLQAASRPLQRPLRIEGAATLTSSPDGHHLQSLEIDDVAEFMAPGRQLFLKLSGPIHINKNENPGGNQSKFDVALPICTGNLATGHSAHLSFELISTCDIDKSPAKLSIDPTHPGSPFDGIGGNFRLQSPADAAQVQFNLANLPVTWARVAMPLDRWQPDEAADPIQAANSGQLNSNVRSAMEMARTLAQKKIPFIISAWQAPQWALLPSDGKAPPPGQGRRIVPEKLDALAKSVGSYLQYLKQNYGAEPRLFSFNESDIGIDVLQSPEEHALTIKRLGAYFASRGLVTKMLLGDTSDPTAVDFINAAMNDPEAVKYLGAVSFHSWRGGTVEQFTRWGAAARKLNLPLLVAEGGTDSDAYRSPMIFLEPWYALDEIAEYIQICRLAQPASILQWQLTSDYSLLTGGTRGQPLNPAQRFWQLKQLGLTPGGAMALPIVCDKSAITPCAFVDPAGGAYTIHLVNNAAARSATISGFPANVKQLRMVVTDANRGMKEMDVVPVKNGAANFTLDAMCFATLTSGPPPAK